MENRKNILNTQLNSLLIKDQAFKALLQTSQNFEIIENVHHSFSLDGKMSKTRFALVAFNSKYLILRDGYHISVSGNFQKIYNKFWKFVTEHSGNLVWQKSKTIWNKLNVSEATPEKPLVFISHDSRDKIAFASKIADGLRLKGCEVIYDEYSFLIGNELRETIEKWIKRSSKFIVIITPNFLKNQGWTKTEFNAVFTRERIEKKNLILPVWCGVSEQELFEYSPMLVDRLGANWSEGVTVVLEKLHRSIAAND